MQRLNTKLEAIAQRLASDSAGQALIALGSSGLELERADEFSDIDFFAIVSPGSKTRFLNDTEWLQADSEIAWIFQNTPDGFKLLWEDGLFGEMAVFEISELPSIAYAPGRVVWQREDVDTTALSPISIGGQLPASRSVDYLQQELLSNLYVGLGRYLRGEKLAGWRFIQNHAFGLALEIIEATHSADPEFRRDLYSRDRRFEFRFPESSKLVSEVLLGIERTPESATRLLDWMLVEGFEENNLVKEVRTLIERATQL